MKTKIVEVVCNNYQSCINAWQAGADRIELIENLSDGGCTPSYGMMKLVKEQIPIPVYVMIRPRGGDFNYSVEEFEIMKSDIQICKELKIDGIVFGILNEKNEIDIVRCQELLGIWNSQKATFHRAVDMTVKIEKSCEQIIELGFERILTSGGKPSAVEGLDNILKLHYKYFSEIAIMAGAGITPDNVQLFSELNEVHSSCKSIRSSLKLVGDLIESDKEIIKNLKEYFV